MIEFKKGTPDAIDCNIYLMSQKKTKRYEISSQSNWKRGTYTLQNPSMPLSLFSSKRRIENNARSRTINASTTAQYKINTHSLSSQTLSQTYKALTFILNWISAGGITMSASRRATNTKQPSKHVTAYMNQLSCSLASLTPQLPSRR